jgi:endoglucanase
MPGFNFHMGNNVPGEIYLDNLSLKKIADAAQSAPSGLYRGINVSNALDAPTEGEWGEVLEESYFQMIKATGFDHVRIPIRWSTRALYEAPYTIDQTFFARVDWAINNTLSRNMIAIIDMHHYHEIFGTQPEDSPVYPPGVVLGPENNKDRFLAMWAQIAEHYKDYPDTLFFELLNEPNTELTPELWNQYLLEVYNIIRATNPTRKIVIGTPYWGGLYGLDSLQIPAGDPNIIVTFHYYEPLELCFQGAEWIPGSDQWLGTTWEGTEEQKRKVRDDFDAAVGWAKNHGDVPLWLGEFHVIKYAEQASRIRWITFVTREAERRGIGWSYWGFCSNEAGIYDETTGTWDTDIVNCLIPE